MEKWRFIAYNVLVILPASLFIAGCGGSDPEPAPSTDAVEQAPPTVELPADDGDDSSEPTDGQGDP